jgi:hypothetical protein
MMTIYLQQLQDSHVTDTDAIVNIIKKMRLRIKQADLLDAQKKADIAKAQKKADDDQKKADIAEAQKKADIANNHAKLVAQQSKAAQQRTKTAVKTRTEISSRRLIPIRNQYHLAMSPLTFPSQIWHHLQVNDALTHRASIGRLL